ncbi:MAG TPA: hypothetical protein VFG64_09625, partial [Dongiaceae bacterium]|nr:hypothetical protein [Dongiaceae bacterium]
MASMEADAGSSAAGLARRTNTFMRGRVALVIVLVLTLGAFWILGLWKGSAVPDLLSLTVWGVMLGGVISLGAIGLTLVYGVLKFPNFAHGALVTLGAYFAYSIATVLPQGAPLRPFSFGFELIVALLLSMPIVAAVAVVMDRVLFRPLRNRGASLVLFAMAS